MSYSKRPIKSALFEMSFLFPQFPQRLRLQINPSRRRQFVQAIFGMSFLRTKLYEAPPQTLHHSRRTETRGRAQ
jgi:hypothetical protein